MYVRYGVFPPLKLLNDYLALGEQNEGMGNNADWIPFCVTEEGYEILFSEVQKLKPYQEMIIFAPQFTNIKKWRYHAIKFIAGFSRPRR